MGVKERILMFCESKGISVRQFEIKCQMSNGYVSSMRKGIGQKKLEQVLNVFPDLNREWLLYGEGDMFMIFDGSDVSHHKNQIPVYNLTATAGLVGVFQDQNIKPVEFISIPDLPRVDGAIYVRGDSMDPLIKSGDIVVFKKVELSLDNIIWGQIYLLSYTFNQDDYTVIKYIKKSKREGYIQLVSANPLFDPQDIPSSSITALALVKASITFHTIE